MPEPIRIREDLPANLGVLAYLSPAAGHAPLAEAPEDHADPYQGAGSHPDVVEHLWVRLNGALPADCRVVVYGSPALAHPEAGVVLALAMGTSYALRLQSADRDTAMAAGAEPVHEYSAPKGHVVNAPLQLGSDSGCSGDGTVGSRPGALGHTPRGAPDSRPCPTHGRSAESDCVDRI
jgi:hypothetical protein